jgi:hypothetical protein
MPAKEIEEFAQSLIQHVRDRAIESADILLEPLAKSVSAKRWHAKGASESRDLALEMIPDCVDKTVFFLLDAIDCGLIRLSYTAANGKVVDLHEEGMGELGGWYAGIDPWITNYSKQRYVDDYEDMRSG